MVVSKSLTVRFDLFHLKWITQDKQIDHDSAAPDQYINHFQNNKELTSKSFLKKNLENFYDGDLELFDYFPRAYDFSFPQASKNFVSDYVTNTLFCILKKTLVYCEIQSEHTWSYVENEKYKIEKLIEEEKSLKERIWFPKLNTGYKPVILIYLGVGLFGR